MGAISKETEIDIREKMKKELEEHFENEKEQIKVDAHAEIAETKKKYEEENARLKDDLAKIQKVGFFQSVYESEIDDYKHKVRKLEKELNKLRRRQSNNAQGSTT